MLLSEKVLINITGANQKHYIKLGYDVLKYKDKRNGHILTKRGTQIEVEVKDLTTNSHVEVDVSCDYCGDIRTIPYQRYNSQIEKYGENLCSKCRYIRMKKDIKEKYNVNNVSQLNEIKDKKKHTTYLNYGVSNPAQSLDVQKKIKQTLFKNNNAPCSSQQEHICNLLGGVLNYPLLMYSLDIFIEEDNIVIEYNGGGHRLSIVYGNITLEEFNRKELIRNKTIHDAGYRLITFECPDDKLPDDKEIKMYYKNAKDYFESTGHTWRTYYFDTGKYEDAETRKTA